MSSNGTENDRSPTAYKNREGLDVDWLLHSKRDFPSHHKDNARSRQDAQAGSPAPNKKIDQIQTRPTQETSTPTQTPVAKTSTPAESAESDLLKSTHTSTQAQATQQTNTASRQPSSRQSSVDEGKHASRSHLGGLKKEGRRSSWITSLSNKLSGGSNTSKHGGVDMQKSKSPLNSPKTEVGNPFDKKPIHGQHKSEEKELSNTTETPIHVPSSPRRPSVLVAAGSETKVEQPGFLSSALRRLSSSNAVTLGKGAGQGALCPRKIMNVDQNRERAKLPEFEQNKLKRVAFCVDVEIAGVAAHSEEQHHTPTDVVSHHPPTSHMQHEIDAPISKDVKAAKYKEQGEGAALKNPQNASQEKDQAGKTRVDVMAERKESKEEQRDLTGSSPTDSIEGKTGDQAAATTTRKKEKKKRSEAERKERKEKKRKQAEANGLVPLELTRDDDDSDSSPSTTPPGTNTPRRNADQPTTDPLRIYKRCCQLRETTALNVVKEQINRPAATLAEAPGTVAVVDLSGNTMSLQDVATLGDWLAVVPVRKLVIDDCNLGDEAIRIILSGLSSCKTSEQARQNRKIRGKRGQEAMGVIEKLSLKNNTQITSLGWKHIALFMHMSRSLRGIDLSGIPFPKPSSNINATNGQNGSNKSSADVGSLVARAISERVGDKLEELIVSGCGLSSRNVTALVDAVIKCRVRRLGLAGNNLEPESFEHVVRYIKSGICEGLDLGSNNLHEVGHVITDALDAKNPLFALSLSDCDLTPSDLNVMLPRFTALSNFKFIDLSRNHELFTEDNDAVPIFRKTLPKMASLKRIHLADVNLTSDIVIALAEVFPDCPSLAHVNILENDNLVKAMNAKSSELQEEAAAFLASLMTAARVSHTIIAIEIEVPSAETSEVVRALASQLVAYSLRNMERSALSEVGVVSSHAPDKDTPEVLLHLVGHMDGYSENHDDDEPAPDEDYLIASTGIVKALGVCLRNKDGSRVSSRNHTPTASGTATPRRDIPLRPSQRKKPKDVSLELCEGARKIRMRLRPALVKEDRAGNQEAYRRLAALDGTLERIIQRFEDEYPETKPNPEPSSSLTSSLIDFSSPMESPDISRVSSRVETDARKPDGLVEGQEQDPYSLKLSRTSSNTSLAARALTHEEGRMHRFGQSMRRELLKPTGTDDFAHGTSVDDAPEPAHLAALRSKLEHLTGGEIRHRVNEIGADGVIRELGVNAEELKALKTEDPEGFEAFRDSQLAAQINAGMLDDDRQMEMGDDHIGSRYTDSNGKENSGSGSGTGSKTLTGGSGIYAQVTG